LLQMVKMTLLHKILEPATSIRVDGAVKVIVGGLR
jgi:hypothetical protein